MFPTSHLPRHPFFLLFIFLLASNHPAIAQDEEENPVTVGDKVTAVEKGDTVEIQCSTTSSETLEWYMGENSTGLDPIPQDTTQRVYATDGLLTVTDTRLNDTGFYLCQTSSGNYSVTTELHVYEMPSYLMEGMIIFAISGGLLFLLIACFVYQHVQRKKAKAEEEKRKSKKYQGQKNAGLEM